MRRKRAFDVSKPVFEFGVGAAQCMFRIGADMARQIDQREQEIAGFFTELIGVAAIECARAAGTLARARSVQFA